MVEKDKNKHKSEEYTILLMKDITSEPIQYKVKVKHLKLAVMSAVVIPVLLVITLATTGTKCVVVNNKYKSLDHEFKVINNQYCASDQTLAKLSRRLVKLENEHEENCARAEVVISALEKDLNRWIPDGAIGGEQLQEDMANTVGISPLSSSQIEKIKEIENKLNVLDSKLDGYLPVVIELDESNKIKNNIFEAIPSMWPLREGWVTSEFGMRYHPVLKKYMMHSGVDIAANTGTVVHSTAPGVVVFSSWKGAYGKAITIDHGFGLSSFYAHCSKLLVDVGDSVEKGQQIAQVGTTGRSTGPHLHFEIRLYGESVDPMEYLSPFSSGSYSE
jgi:septal ring factor EnvC (AmiA/AmiB activator)